MPSAGFRCAIKHTPSPLHPTVLSNSSYNKKALLAAFYHVGFWFFLSLFSPPPKKHKLPKPPRLGVEELNFSFHRHATTAVLVAKYYSIT